VVQISLDSQNLNLMMRDFASVIAALKITIASWLEQGWKDGRLTHFKSTFNENVNLKSTLGESFISLNRKSLLLKLKMFQYLLISTLGFWTFVLVSSEKWIVL